MAQALSPLFGEFYTDTAVARAVAFPAGLVSIPSIAFTGDAATGFNVQLQVNPARGFWAWRTAWKEISGSSVITEDTTLTLVLGAPPTTGKKNVLIVGRWKWIAGPVDSKGKPTGAYTETMKAVYEVVAGEASATPTDPAVSGTDAAGRFPVILGRVVLEAGQAPVWQWIPETMLDMTTLAAIIAGKMNRVGDEIHDGALSVTHAPTDAMHVVRKGDFAGLMGNEITLGPGSTAESGYAMMGGLAMAWVKGPSTWFTWQTNPIVSINTPISFNKIYTYALSTENSEEVISDNDAWWQLVKAVDSGNTFQAIAQCPGNKGAGGWIRPILWVLGEPTPHNPTITNVDWNGMALNGQTYPKLLNIQLASVGGIGAITWEIVGGTATAAFLAGYPSIVQVSIGAVGTTTLIVKATDSLGATATKTINITLAAYTQVPLVISSSGYSSLADIYPWDVSFTPTSTGGDAPITWAIVAGANTTLPSAAITAGKVTGVVADEGTWTVELQATDSSNPAQVVTKIVPVAVTTYVEPPATTCFEAGEVFVLMADRTGRLLKEVRPGEMVMGVSEQRFDKGNLLLGTGMVTDITLREATGGEPPSVIVAGVKSTEGHPWGDGEKKAWTRAKELQPDTMLVEAPQGKSYGILVPAGEITRGEAVQIEGNLATTIKTFFVGATAEGPWRLVHNIELQYPSYDV